MEQHWIFDCLNTTHEDECLKRLPFKEEKRKHRDRDSNEKKVSKRKKTDDSEDDDYTANG